MKVDFDIKKAITESANIAIKILQEELENQGHNATDALSNSIKSSIKNYKDGARANIYVYLYGAYVNFGVTSSKFRFGGDKHLANLRKWIKAKGITINEGVSAKSFAYAIVKKHAKEGIPTANSYSFSKNGKRTGFITDSFALIETEIESNMQAPDYVGLDIKFEL